MTLPTPTAPRPRRWTALALAASLALGAAACGDDGDDGGAEASGAERTVEAEPTAGTWRTWVLKSPTEVRVPPPPAEGSSQADAEEEQVRELAGERTPEVEDIIRKWATASRSAPRGSRWRWSSSRPGRRTRPTRRGRTPW
jgi:hypothetical protein